MVLVHGTNLDTSSWSQVAKQLRRDGYPVVASTNPLRGLKYDAAYTASVLRSVKGPVILVGHSYGAAVVNEAALSSKNVKALVSVAGFLPEKGESPAELVGKYPGSTLAGTLDKVPYPLLSGGTGTELYVNQDQFPQQFAADLPLSVSSVLAVSQRPVDAKALDEKASGAAWKTIPAYDLITAEDKNIPAAAQRWMAKRAHAVTVEIHSSHVAPLSHPEAVTDLVEQAAGRTPEPSTTALASTGSSTWALLGGAAGLTAVGGALLLTARRTRRS
ncbi:alpha/beta hydrolase [Streptomyces sp. NPDC006333]|uniref:alpha/beta hydrolase n=1 Tax=Streptomyces sp. NPDC006333 TaxID=3156753 RepID=UPI0033A8E65F